MEILAQFADLLGIIGVALTLIAYFLLSINKISAKEKIYSILNLVGSSLIMYSLIFDWNTPAALMECAWIFISLYGVIKASSLPLTVQDPSFFPELKDDIQR